jgi:hypothetical protein
VVIAFPYYYLGNELIRSRFNRWRAIGWLAVLIGGSVAASKFGGSQVGQGFMAGYIFITIAFLIAKSIRRRRSK